MIFRILLGLQCNAATWWRKSRLQEIQLIKIYLCASSAQIATCSDTCVLATTVTAVWTYPQHMEKSKLKTVASYSSSKAKFSPSYTHKNA